MWTFLFYQNFPWFLHNLSYTTLQWKISFFYFFYTQMKKSIFLFGLLATALCLTACGSKDYNMTFEEALETANHSALQDILAENDNFEQEFDIAGSFDKDWTSLDANIASSSKQNINNNNTESSIKFDAKIASEGETVKANWALDIKIVDDGIYLNLSALDLTGSEDLWFVALMAEWFKNQWFSIPMSGLSDLPSTFSILKDKDLDEKAKEVVTNEWATIYSWKFTQFEWYNAWKFSLDNEKLNALIKEYYSAMYSNLNEEMTGGMTEEFPEINIQNFEWSLVITWKDKVTTVIENMEMQDNDTIISIYWFGWEDYEIYMNAWDEPMISIVANKKWWKYNIDASLANTILLNWTISPKLSKSSIDLKFDAKITVKAEEEWETDTIIPFKGSWKYNSISEFSVTAPEDAQDLSELLWAYLWNMMWGDDYAYDYEDYDYEDIDYSEEEAGLEDVAEEAVEEVAEAE